MRGVGDVGAETIAAGQQLRTRRTAQRRGVAIVEPYPRAGKLVKSGRLIAGTAVAAKAFRAEIVGENEDDIGLTMHRDRLNRCGNCIADNDAQANQKDDSHDDGFCCQQYNPPVNA